jgi:hypothetical protein
LPSIPRRPYAWEFSSLTEVSTGGLVIVFGEIAPPDQVLEVEGADIVHNGVVATDLAIGVFQAGRVVLYVSSATDAARPLAGVPVVLPRRVVVPPMWQLIGAANNLAAAETVTIRFLQRRDRLE